MVFLTGARGKTLVVLPFPNLRCLQCEMTFQRFLCHLIHVEVDTLKCFSFCCQNVLSAIYSRAPVEHKTLSLSNRGEVETIDLSMILTLVAATRQFERL